jgi:hypothetical protein
VSKVLTKGQLHRVLRSLREKRRTWSVWLDEPCWPDKP